MADAPSRLLRSAWAWAGALAFLLLILQAAGDGARLALRLESAAVARGEWWRLFTAHAVHLSWPHALLNAAGVFVCCALAPAVFNGWLALRVGALALGISLCLYRLSPEALPYVGLSGVLYGLFVLGLAPQARRLDAVAIAALIAITGWMLRQWLTGPLQSEERLIGGAIASVAHLYGYGLAFLGLLAAPLAQRMLRSKARGARPLRG